MEIRNGYGIGGTRVTGPVRVGDPLTLMIYMRSKYDGFDIVVNDCYAHNGANKRIQLIDEYGWVNIFEIYNPKCVKFIRIEGLCNSNSIKNKIN